VSVPPVRVVAVPGLGLDGRSLKDVAALIPLSVVLLPGMGLGRPVPTLDALAGRLLTELGEGPVVLLGHSQSCQIVVAAAERDARVAGVVLVGPTTDPRLRSALGLTWRWLATAIGEPWWQVPRIVAQWWSTGPRAMVALWRGAAPDRIDERIRRLTVPVVVVRGMRDRLCANDWAQHLASVAPQGRLLELPGVAHMAVQTAPAEVAGIVRQLGAGY
jgi:pimeloyl-ACP methyl ester carboxylesterase